MGGRVDDNRAHGYPPVERLERYWPFDLPIGPSSAGLIVIVVVVALVDLVRVGFPDTGIPYNYPLFLGVLYLIAVAVLLKRYHQLIDLAKLEILDVLERTDLQSDLHDRETDITAECIRETIDGVLDDAFSPAYLALGAFLAGCFAIAVMWFLGAFEYFPYLLMNFAYGAGHGLFFAPILATGWLVWTATRNYIVDIDVLDPDGVGGYRQVGDSIVNLITYGIVLVTLDFLVISSVVFVDEPQFQALVLAMYASMLFFLLGFAVVGILGLRHAMLEIRDRKTDALREEFSEVEDRYYQKLENREDPSPEAEHIETMTTMFDQFNSMGLWPIDLASFVRLASTASGSIVIAAYQMDFISYDFATLLLDVV